MHIIMMRNDFERHQCRAADCDSPRSIGVFCVRHQAQSNKRRASSGHLLRRKCASCGGDRFSQVCESCGWDSKMGLEPWRDEDELP